MGAVLAPTFFGGRGVVQWILMTFKAPYSRELSSPKVSVHPTRSDVVGTLQVPSLKCCHLVDAGGAFSTVAPTLPYPSSSDPADPHPLSLPKSHSELVFPPTPA